MSAPAHLSGLDRFWAALDEAVQVEALAKLTLGRPCGPDRTLQNVYLRPVQLRGQWQLSFVYRHDTRDITKNYAAADALIQLRALIPAVFRDAHLFTPAKTVQLTCEADGNSHCRTKLGGAAAAPVAAHDRTKARAVPESIPWLADLGVTTAAGKVREEMTGKFRQINRFVELVAPLVREADLGTDGKPFRIVDMGCGKGYLTFALASHYPQAEVAGVESRPALVDSCNALAQRHSIGNLRFQAGRIEDTPSGDVDVLIALHACDTATDDALAAGVRAKAALLIVSPCCQKELRPQLKPAAVLAPALRHGIFAERHAEFVTDALRALLLESSGYRTQVFEFVSTEHTAKNLMIAAVRLAQPSPEKAAAALESARALAALYGVKEQRLARHLGHAL